MDRTTFSQGALRRHAGVGLLLAAALIAIPTIAPAAEPVTRRVKISDLNLTSPQGRQTLERRLRVAIDQACSPSASTNRLGFSRRQIEECRQNAWADAQRQLEQHGLPPLLTASN